jgi:hypothetical protein
LNRVGRLSDQPKPLQVFLGPASFVLDDLLEGTDGENLPWAVEVNGHAPAISMFKKTGGAFASGKGEPVALERRHYPARGQTTEP